MPCTQPANAGGGLFQIVMDEYIKSAHLDAPTGLWNRVYTEERVDALLKENSRQGALLLMEIDKFYQVSKCYDRSCGDADLRTFAEVILLAIEECDVAGRVGGDKFLVSYAKVEEYEEAEKRVSNILAAIQEKLRLLEMPCVTISASPAMMPTDGANFNTLYRNGDKSLYFAKK